MELTPEILDYIKQVEQGQGLPEGTVNAFLTAESNGNPRATSPAGAQGLMQLMPDTAKARGVTDPYDPYQSIKGGAAELGDLWKKYSGDIPKVAAAYNWGQGNVDRKGMDALPPETQKYIPKIMSLLPGGQAQAADTVRPVSTMAQSARPDAGVPTDTTEKPKGEGLMGKILPLVFRFGLPTIASAVIGGKGGFGALAPALGTLASAGIGQLNQNTLDKKAAADTALDLKKLGVDYGFKQAGLDLNREKLDFEKGKAQSAEERNAALDKSLIDYRTAQTKSKQGGKTLSNSQAAQFGEADNALDLIKDRQAAAEGTDQLGGPIKGRIMGNMPYAAQTKNFKADLDLSRQLIGKYLEGGVLRKEDENKYKDILPTVNDLPSVVAHKWAELYKRVEAKRTAHAKAFQKLGYYVGDYADGGVSPLDVKAQADSEGASVEGTPAQETNTNVFTTDDGLEYTIE